MLTDLTVGWVGLGRMGKPMSLRLHKAGARVCAASRTRSAVDEMVGHGLLGAQSPREAARNADVVIMTVFDAASVRAVLGGDDGIIAGLREGTLVVDMGTTEVAATRNFAQAVTERGGAYLDAPVSGGVRGAAEGTLTIMAGGEAADLQRAMPVFSILGKNVTHMGPAGAGQATKAANQLIVGITITAVAEAFALAAGAGVDLAKVREALQGGFADSRILQEHGLRMIAGNYAPGGTIAAQRKDLRQALSLAVSLDLNLPVSEATAKRFNDAAERGFDQLDHSAVFKLLEPAGKGNGLPS
jgi:3-hydroxyisobutyrate dehydrogenase-like beta-hydroxyacid dehydrogenase